MQRDGALAVPIKDNKGEIIGWRLVAGDDERTCSDQLLFPWVPHQRNTWPYRYMTAKEPVTLQIWQGHGKTPEYVERVVPAGGTLKIVMVSRFGDVGLTDVLDSEFGYHTRVDRNKLEAMFENFRNQP